MEMHLNNIGVRMMNRMKKKNEGFVFELVSSRFNPSGIGEAYGLIVFPTTNLKIEIALVTMK
jgi:hypothetical protein